MPQLVWEPLDLLNVLGVAPEVTDYGAAHKYVVTQAPIRLEITLWQYDGDIQFNLFIAPFEGAVVRYSMLGCPAVRVANDKRGPFLEFAAANTFTGRYDGYSVIPYGLRVWVEPHVCLEPFVYPS